MYKNTDNYCLLESLRFFGHYKGEDGLRFIWGTVDFVVFDVDHIEIRIDIGTDVLGIIRFRDEAWSFNHRVTACPMGPA